MHEFTKTEWTILRELAGTVYEAEAHSFLAELDAEFARWRGGEIFSSDLLRIIHDFHQQKSRELWSMYRSLKEPEVVARGVALGFLPQDEVPEAVRQKLQARVELFARWRE